MLIVTGQCFKVGDDYEAAARHAVAEEAAERARMAAASGATPGDPGDEFGSGRSDVWRVADERLALIHQQAEALEGLHRELAARLALIERQATALSEARTVFVLLVGSRSFRVMRALGRWGWLDRRIRQILR